MICQVKLFAAARQFAGAEQVTVELPAGATVADLRQALAAAHPELSGLLAAAMLAIDTQYARDSDPVPPGAEIAVIPPVSGG